MTDDLPPPTDVNMAGTPPGDADHSASPPEEEQRRAPARATPRRRRKVEPPTPPIHHLGIAVESIEEAMRFYGEKLGLAIVDERTLEDRALRIAFVQTGNTLLELLQPTDPESTVAKFIERRGPGLHHICFGTLDIAEHLRDLRDKGVELIDEVARPGAHGDVAFIQPSAAHGVLVELIQPGPVSQGGAT